MSQIARLAKSVFLLFCFLSSQVYALEWKNIYDQTSLALLWQQHAHESKALSWQTFNMAVDIIDQHAEDAARAGKKPAMVSDIDDTLISATRFYAGLIGSSEKRTPERDRQWWHEQPATLLPGAKHFLDYVHSKGVDILYLSARQPKQSVIEDTLTMLTKAGLPSVDGDHLLVTPGFQKSSTIQQWGDENNRQVIFTIGDKMADLGLHLPLDAKVQQLWVEANPSRPGDHSLIQANAFHGIWECVSYGTCPHDADKEQELRQQKARDMIGSFLSTPTDLTFSEKIYRAEELGQALEWTNQSAEYAYITRQVYNKATQFWKQPLPEQGAAVIVDVDGTVIKNTQYSAHVFLNNHTKEGWQLFDYWVALNQPPIPVPGAKEFLQSVKDAGGEIFYVTNRRDYVLNGTSMRTALKTSLEKAGVPMPDEQHLLMHGDFGHLGAEYQDDNSKKARYKGIRTGLITGKPVNVVQIIGDRIEDLEIYEEDLALDNNDAPSEILSQLGRQRFLLPFPLYTQGWLKRLYKQWHGDNWQDLSTEELAESRHSHIDSWKPPQVLVN